jgi:hypothetical protein
LAHIIPNKTELIAKEFIAVGKLEEFTNEINAIIQKITSRDCRISTHYILKNKSSILFESTGSIIRIEMSDRSIPIEIIWDILHEYGHFLSGKPETQNANLNREILAWNFAQKELDFYPKLLGLLPDFIAYREHCLDTYRSNLH